MSCRGTGSGFSPNWSGPGLQDGLDSGIHSALQHYASSGVVDLHAGKSPQDILSEDPVDGSFVDFRQRAEVGDFYGFLVPLEVGKLEVRCLPDHVGIQTQAATLHARHLQLIRRYAERTCVEDGMTCAGVQDQRDWL